MPLCTIAPLEDEDWIILMKHLEKGQTEEQAECVRKALALVKKLNIPEN